MTVYIVSGVRKVLHQGSLVNDTVPLTAEACNLDAMAKRVFFTDLSVARGAARRDCRRCMPRESQAAGMGE